MKDIPIIISANRLSLTYHSSDGSTILKNLKYSYQEMIQIAVKSVNRSPCLYEINEITSKSTIMLSRKLDGSM